MTLLGGIIAMVIARHVLPPELEAYLTAQRHKPIHHVYITLVVFLIYIVAIIVSYIGLYRWKAWSRTLFTFIFIIGSLVAPFFTDPIVITAMAYKFITTNCLFCGLLIGCMYYDPNIKARFEKKDEPKP